MHTHRLRKRGWSLLVLLAVPAAASAEPVRLASRELAVEIDPAEGRLLGIENKLTGDTKTLRDAPFRLETSRGELAPRDCRLLKSAHDAASASFTFAGRDLEVELAYRIAGDDANAVRKFLTITNRGADRVTLSRVVVFDWVFPDRWPSGYPHSYHPGNITDVHLHRAGTWYFNPINLFLRDDAGGLFVGVENPVFEASHRCLRKVYPTLIEVSYRPRWLLDPGQAFESEPGFVGVYRQEKVYRVCPDRVYFEGRERLPFEMLDWGEVWAMQKYMEGAMPVCDWKSGRYPLSYWGYSDPGRLGQISRKQLGGGALDPEERAMLAHFGGGPFAFRNEEVWFRLTPDTVKFYKQVVDDAASLGHYDSVVIPNLMAGHSGWFDSEEQKRDAAAVEAMTDDWYERPAFGLWKEVADYAAAKGMGMFTLELTGRSYRRDRPEWSILKADGTRHPARCFAHAPFADWYADRVCRALCTHPLRCWQWDEGWMGGGYIGEEGRCFAEDHTHPPGNVHYHQFRAVQSTLRRLRERHPTVRLTIVSGLIPGMPWVMKYLDGDSHTGTFEHGAWLDHNDLFLPSYKSHRDGSIHWLIERGSAAVEVPAASGWYTMLEDPAAKAAYKRVRDLWTAWADAHLDDLSVRRDLFAGVGAPGGGVEGAAHVRGDRGFLFLHNGGSAAEAGEVPIGPRLGLEGGEAFRVRQVHPEARDFGTIAKGAALTVPVGPRQTLVLEIDPAAGPASPQPPALPPGIPVRKAFQTLEDVKAAMKSEDLWPAAPLPGKQNMPGF